MFVETLQGGVSCMLITDSLSAHTQTETIICLTYFSVRPNTALKKIVHITADYVVLVPGYVLTHLVSLLVYQQKGAK